MYARRGKNEEEEKIGKSGYDGDQHPRKTRTLSARQGVCARGRKWKLRQAEPALNMQGVLAVWG
jgi:hypothetical protein